MTIQVLSDQLASQIAAGEVVERPYSVVKELLENSIDAGATTINIDVHEAGRKSIQVADNGTGIEAEQMETAFLRHATSKLATVDDLNAIYTLGFRGEALAAIAAVSQVTIVSRAQGASSGTRLVLDGGIMASRETVGAPQGTVIAVENLFFNVPARLKFLKTDKTEKRLIDELVTRYALAYPDVRFRLTHNGRITFQSTGSGSVLDVLVAIYGPEIARQLLEIGDDEAQGSRGEEEHISQSPLSVTGFVAPPSIHWANRGHIVLFVNGRWIKDNKLTYAVIQAYHTLLPTGRYPMAVLFLQLPAEKVDVNVHPTKTEVRFRGDKAPFGDVQRSVRQALVADAPIRQMSAWALGSQMEAMTPGWEGNLDQHAFVRPDEPQAALGLEWSDTAVSPATDAEEGEEIVAPQMESQLPIMRVVGQIGATYIISEGPDGLFLIDQHAASYCAVYEQFAAMVKAKNVVTERLSSGTAVTLAPEQSNLLEAHQHLISQLGFACEPFGPNTVMIREIPQLTNESDPAKLIIRMVTALEQNKAKTADAALSELMKCVARETAVRSGQSLNPTEMTTVIQQLEHCRDPFTDPDGKPTFIYLSVAQLAREFGKI